MENAMESEQMRRLREAGLDTQGALGRLMNNESFYVRMLGKFLDDPSFAKLDGACAQEDSEGMRQGAHALKGVAATLGMTELSALCERMQYTLEGREQEDTNTLMTEIRKTYGEATRVVKEVVS